MATDGTMTNAGTASHPGRSEHEDPTAVEVLAARREIKRQDRAFIAQLRAAILGGLETPACFDIAIYTRPAMARVAPSHRRQVRVAKLLVEPWKLLRERIRGRIGRWC